jgi:5'-3' exonuclease
MRGRPGALVENLPLDWRVEQPLLRKQDQWISYYTKEWLTLDSLVASKLYCEGLQWTLNYYTGKSINTDWYYPSSVPPLWCQVLEYLESNDLPQAPSLSTELPIQPIEQLAMVLPLESWHLLEKAPVSLRTLPARNPHYWPLHFSFFSAGRLWMWECEPVIPLLRLSDIRRKPM